MVLVVRVIEPLLIVGAGGFGRETADVVEAINAVEPKWKLVGFVDDAPSELNLARLERRSLAFLGSIDDLLDSGPAGHVVIGIGSPMARRMVAERLSGLRSFATLVHPAATLGSEVRLGEGTVVCSGARLSTNLDLGRHVHVNAGATVGHDTIVEDFVSLNPASSISGDCRVEEGSLIGVGAVVLNQLTVGRGATVGGAACVVKNVSAATVVKGVPAR